MTTTQRGKINKLYKIRCKKIYVYIKNHIYNLSSIDIEIDEFKFFEAATPLEDCRDSKLERMSAVGLRTFPVRS